MEATRKNILRIHGSLLIAMGIAMSIYSTLGMKYGIGTYNFLENNKLGHVGLLQAYLLAALTGTVLWIGSYQDGRKKWNRIGALFHFLILIVYLLHWDFFPTLPSGEGIRNAGVTFHIVFFSLEFWAGVISK
jgi:hypothetical protein